MMLSQLNPFCIKLNLKYFNIYLTGGKKTKIAYFIKLVDLN